MKGTIISGEEVLKRISTGEFNVVKNIYAIYTPAGNVSITPITKYYLGNIMNDCKDPKILFIEIIKEEQ